MLARMWAAACGGCAGSWVRSDLDLADMQVAIMQFTTTRITAPWLTTTTSQRIAGMLNYFLEHLTGGAPV